MSTQPTVRATIDGLRLRESPVDGQSIGQANTPDTLIALEPVGDVRRKLGVQGEWLKVRNPEGVEGYTAAWFLEALDVPELVEDDTIEEPVIDDGIDSSPGMRVEAQDANADEPLYLRSTIDGLRVREAPVGGTPIGMIYPRDLVQSLESAAETRRKVETENEWLKIRHTDGQIVYTAAWLLEITETPQYSGTVNLGVNLDILHPLGKPAPERLSGLGWVRLPYNVSRGIGSLDFDSAFDLYRDAAETYARAGFKVMFVLTHQTYGEGRNEFWPWRSVTGKRWERYTSAFTEQIAKIAKRFAGSDLVHCWQVWNEQDAEEHEEASVALDTDRYAHIFAETYKTIREYDQDVAIITGGHKSGPHPGSKYALNTINKLPSGILPDGIAFHPYGRGKVGGTRYTNWGAISESLDAYTAVLPDRPVWITEWGVLDKEGDAPSDVATYAREFVDTLQNEYPGKVASLIWYAWAMGMHNGYGLVGRDDQPLTPLFDAYRTLRV